MAKLNDIDDEDTSNGVILSDKSSWPSTPKSLITSSEKVKNWSSFIMSITAILTAASTYISPPKGTINTAEKVDQKLILDMQYNIDKIKNDISRLHTLRKDDLERREAIFSLEKMAAQIEDKMIRDLLERKYGEAYADQYLQLQSKYRSQIDKLESNDIEEENKIIK